MLPSNIQDYIGEVLEYSPDIIIIADLEGKVLSFNKGAERLLGYKKEDVLQKNIEDLWERRHDRKKLVEIVKKDGHVADYETLLKTKEGKNLYISLTMSLLKSPSGEIIGTLGMSKNITRRKMLELEQEVMMNIQRSLVSSIDIRDVYTVIASEMKRIINFDRMSIVLKNHRYVRQNGGTEEKQEVLVNFAVTEGDVGELSMGKSFDLRGSMLERMIQTKAPVLVKDTKDNKFSTDKIFYREGIRSRLGYPIIYKGNIIGSINLGSKEADAFTEDHYNLIKQIVPELAVSIENTNLYTELKESNKKLIAANKELEEVNRLKSEFLANMSHELRTPLNSILSISTILLDRMDGDLTDEQEKQLKIIENNGKHLLKLINDLLDLEKIKSGKMEILLGEIDMEEIMAGVRITIDPLLLQAQIALDVRIEDGLPVVCSDRDKLRQILLNLLENAIKFTKKGGKITLSCESTTPDNPRLKQELTPISSLKGDPVSGKGYDKYILISVKDTGIGIPEDALPYIFDEFRQVDGSTTRKYGGTGLGLTITKRLVELLGGTIYVKSRLGEGSTFAFTLPMVGIRAASEKMEDLYVEPETIDRSKRVILVVEDDENSFYIMRKFLEKENCQIFRAKDGEEAIEKAKMIMPFAMTLDIMIPKKDGWEVMKIIKDNPQTASIPIIVISIIDNKQLGFTLGASEYMVKPIDKERLIHWLDNIAKKRMIREVLLVDDDYEQIYAIEKILKERGYKVSTAKDGRDALDILEKREIDLVTLDLMMPGMDGFQVLEELKKWKKWRGIPVLIITAKELSQEEKEKINANVRMIFEKGSYELSDLMEEIHSLINRRSAERRRKQDDACIEKRKKDRRRKKE